MDNELIMEVKKRKIFSGLPDSLVWRFLEKNNLDVKSARADLRKFFGVFLTNKVLKGKGEGVLKNHISSKERDYKNFYGEIFNKGNFFESLVDLGCGVNGLSLLELHEYTGTTTYTGIEASRQISEIVNSYFDECPGYLANVIWMDLFDLRKVIEVIKISKSPRCVLMLQVIDALEGTKKNYSKELLLKIEEVLSIDDRIVISMPMRSISGKKKFEARRTWLSNFLEDIFAVLEIKEIGNEKLFILGKK